MPADGAFLAKKVVHEPTLDWQYALTVAYCRRARQKKFQTIFQGYERHPHLGCQAT